MTDLGCLGLIQSRFRLFWHDSRPISAFTIRFGWYDLNQRKSKPSWRKSKPSQRKSQKKKKKNSDVAPTRGQQWWWPHPTSNSGAAPSQLRGCFLVLDPLENCLASALSYHHVVRSFEDSAMVREFAKRFYFYEIDDIFFVFYSQ